MASEKGGKKTYNIESINKAEFNTTYHNNNNPKIFFIVVFVIAIIIIIAYLFIENLFLKQPITLTVRLNEIDRNQELPPVNGTIILTYNGKSDSRENIKKEVTYIELPPNLRDKTVYLYFTANGYLSIDTSFLLTGSTIELKISRDSSLAKIIGLVMDSNNKPLNGVLVSTQEINCLTDDKGHFILYIPKSKQKLNQRLDFFKKGYYIDGGGISTPVIPNQLVRVNLIKDIYP